MPSLVSLPPLSALWVPRELGRHLRDRLQERVRDGFVLVRVVVHDAVFVRLDGDGEEKLAKP